MKCSVRKLAKKLTKTAYYVLFKTYCYFSQVLKTLKKLASISYYFMVYIKYSIFQPLGPMKKVIFTTVK